MQTISNDLQPGAHKEQDSQRKWKIHSKAGTFFCLIYLHYPQMINELVLICNIQPLTLEAETTTVCTVYLL